MARIRGSAGYKPQTCSETEVFQWLKTLSLAPEFHPTLEEFQDPIAYIHKIEKEASAYGICKIIPPVSLPTKKTTVLELNKSLFAYSASPEGEIMPTFTTRVQQVGSCSIKDHPAIKSIRESGNIYTLSEFEAKARTFEKNYFKRRSMDKEVLSPLEMETMYWNASAEKSFDVEYANDMLGSAFVKLDKRRGREGLTENMNVGDSKWNLRGAARSEGCPLRFVEEDIPGVTSPMMYLGMMFSWFAWHVEDHDLHSLNYMHMGDTKTWYGVPMDAATKFEEVIRNNGYGGQMNHIVAYATLAKKNTVMSPEVIVNAGIPCYRLVQNAGEFVVTFPRAYHSGFSHGFNCAEASNIATPEWLRFAREATIRRAASNYPPLVSAIQLLYDFAMSFSSRVPMTIEPKSSSIKEKEEGEGECLVKELFLQDVIQNMDRLHSLGKGSPAIILPPDFIENTGLFSCVACGVLCYFCAAIIKPMPADCGDGYIGGSGISSEVANNWWTRSSGDTNNAVLDSGLGRMAACSRHPKEISSLALLALNYGDATDSETESGEDSPAYQDCSSAANHTEIGVGSPLVTVQSRDTLFAPNSDEDSSISHVFCLEHAFEVEQKLCAIGGVHILLLCHPDYPKFLAETKVISDSMGADHMWRDISLRTATKEDQEMIKSALNSELSIHGNADWAAKLGVNLFYSANLGHSPPFSKQIPYNSVIYKAFGLDSSADTPAIPDAVPERSSKSQTICLSSEGSKATLKRKSMADTEPTLRGKSTELEEIVKATDDAPKQKCTIQYQRRFRKNLKQIVQEDTPRPETNQDQGSKLFDINMLEEGGPSTRQRPRISKQPAKLEGNKSAKRSLGIQASASKRAKKSEEKDYACNIEDCPIKFGSEQELVQHEKNICSVQGCRKNFASHKYLVHHQKVHRDDRPLVCPWKDCKKTFKWAWARTEHVRIHTGERPYTCGETGCGKTFRFVSDFSRHKRKTGHAGKLQE